MKTDKVLVVRYHIQDDEAFRPVADKAFESLKNSETIDGAVVTAIDTRDTFEELERLEYGDPP